MESWATLQHSLQSQEMGKGSFCASSYPGNRIKVQYWPLPIIKVVVNNTVMTGLVDTVCTITLIKCKLMCRSCTVKAIDGWDIKCKGAQQVVIKIHGVRVKLKAILMNRAIDGIDVIIGMNVINEMGDVTIKKV